jgi:hypothetical protein
MSYKVAAIDIHKSVLMVVVATAANEIDDPIGEALEFECRRFGTGHSERTQLVSWLGAQEVSEVVMESTAQYWKPGWLDLEPHFAKLHLAQAHSNRAPKGRKNDFRTPNGWPGACWRESCCSVSRRMPNNGCGAP